MYMVLLHEKDEDCISPSLFTVRKVSVFSLLWKETKKKSNRQTLVHVCGRSTLRNVGADSCVFV